MFRDDFLDSLSPKEQRLWREMQEVRRLHGEALKLFRATADLAKRAELANIYHEERELDEDGRPLGKTRAIEEIERDNWRRAQDQKMQKAAMFGNAIKGVIQAIRGEK